MHTEAAGTAPPDAFGPFRVLHQVGAGTLGPVFRAYDPERDRLVAVKLFKLDLPPERLNRLVAEFERLIGAALAHDAIAAPLATGTVGAYAYLAQDYITAESFDLAVQAYGPAPAGDALRVAAQLAGAIDFAAVVNIHHGALHPRDVLLTPDETRLTGVGIAGALEQVGIVAPVRQPYTAPERIAGGPWDRRADIFSLAALIHELLWGRRIAGPGPQATEGLTDVGGGDPDALRVVFARALAHDPAERFDTALEFVELLKNALPAITIGSQRLSVLSGPPGEPGGQSRRSRVQTDGIRPATDKLRLTPPLEPRLPLGDSDLDLRAAEEARYADVEVAPAIVADHLSTTEDRRDTESRTSSLEDSSSVSSVATVVMSSRREDTERPGSRTWPMVLMLIVGVALGFGAGYLLLSRSTRTQAPPPAGREFTEGTVPEAPQPAPPTPDAGAARLPPPPDASADRRTPGRGSLPDEDAVRTRADATGTTTGPGRLLVRSTPSGATVFVDGRESGRTPVAIRGLASGTHRVQVVRDGYAPAERRIVITRRQLAQAITVPLVAPREASSRGTQSSTPAPSTPGTIGRFTGDLVVESKPPRAKVYLDNKLIGTTPASLSMVPAGNHVIRIELEGYRRWASSVRIVAAERNRVTASLER